MEFSDIKRLALVLAVQAEIEGMKVTNRERLENNFTEAHDEEAFVSKSDELKNLANANNEQLDFYG